MKRLTLILALLALPLAPGAAITPTYAASPVSELGDLSALHAIADDTLHIATAGDLKAAELRITDFESAWDDAAGTMQPLSPPKWAAIDTAADAAIASLRTATPVQAAVEAALSALIAQLDNPAGSAATPPAAAAPVAAAFAVTNADGSPLPCEVALKTLRDAATGKTPSDQAKYDEALNKGLERCNADDDKRADGFFAGAFALLN